MSTLVTKTIQLNELRKLRQAAVKASKEISDHDAKLAKMISESLRKQQPYHRPASPGGPTATVHAAMTSTAEAVMTQYSTPPAPTTFSRPSLQPFPTSHYGPATTQPPSHPDSNPVVDPYTGYISPHSRDFRGCLGCGDSTHQYKDCKLNRTEPTHSLFTKNFLARYPDKRKYPPRPEEVTTLVAIPPPNPTNPSILRNPASSGIGRGAGANLPAWMTRREGPTPPPEEAEASTKKVRLCTVFVKILQQSASSPRPRVAPFPIRINNLMPAITFDLGPSPASAVSLVCLYDTCAAVCSGNLLFHQWVITSHPDLVHSFEQFDDSNPFEAIKLVGALKDPADFDVDTYGQLTAVVRYHLPYSDLDSTPTVLCIALGADVSVNTILGWPAIEDLGIELRLKSELFFSTTLRHSFPLTRVEAPFGLPNGVDFVPARDFKRPGPCPSPPVPTLTVSLPPSTEFNPSRQMQELCSQLTAATRPSSMLAPGPSATATMHARASGQSTPFAILLDSAVIEGPSYDASPLHPS
jgi:hypothetical protein